MPLDRVPLGWVESGQRAAVAHVRPQNMDISHLSVPTGAGVVQHAQCAGPFARVVLQFAHRTAPLTW